MTIPQAINSQLTSSNREVISYPLLLNCLLYYRECIMESGTSPNTMSSIHPSMEKHGQLLSTPRYTHFNLASIRQITL